MSIILKGIDLPKEKEIIMKIRPNGCVVGEDELSTFATKAIQIPKGHGRIIDASTVFTYSAADEKLLAEAPTILEAEE